MSDNASKNTAELVAAQQAYDTSYNVHQYVTKNARNTRLMTTFGLAAGVGSMFLFASPLVPLVLINAAFIYETYQNRAANMRLAGIFNEVSGEMEPEGRYHLVPIATELDKVEPIDFQDLNPAKLFQESPIVVAIAGVGAFLAPSFIPGILAAVIGMNDKSRFQKTAQAAVQVGEELERLYPNQLKAPGGEPPPAPPPA